MYGFPKRRVGSRGRIIIKTPREIDFMMRAGEVAALALNHVGEMITPGISTWELNRVIGDFIKRKGARASFKGLYGFPGNACISINSELIHGIPSRKRFIRAGDIVTIDIGANKDGYHGDVSKTFACSGFDNLNENAQKLLRTTEQALRDAICQCMAGNRIGDISNAIQTQIEGSGYFIPDDYLGHGVGRDLHEDPNVPNTGPPGRGARLTPGMTLAIEPMANSTTKKTEILRDEWTVVEANGNLSAHFEHTVLITSGSPVVMTLLK
ncbi:MAG: type I methionyl aminopeptidase [Oscillospiraceae bacterium]|nr:type I methionyl aminopeptidase [Oscillospiraceae bacterium]